MEFILLNLQLSGFETIGEVYADTLILGFDSGLLRNKTNKIKLSC